MPQNEDPNRFVAELGSGGEWAEVRRVTARALLRVFILTIALTSAAVVILSSIPPVYPERLIAVLCFASSIVRTCGCLSETSARSKGNHR